MNDEVLYLESDEEITTAIDKLIKLKGAKVSIVVPKRSTLLQSIVNQKLLKKAAADAGKELVLVTADRTAAHLAGKVGLAVASTLKGEASIPDVGEPTPVDNSEIVEDEEPEPVEPAADAAPSSDDLAAAAVPAASAAKSAKPSFAKPMLVKGPVNEKSGKGKTRIPDFNALQKRLLLVGGIVAVIILLLVANFFLTSAKVTLYAKGTEINTDFSFSADPNAKDSDFIHAVLAAQNLQSSKDLTGSFTASGKKDVGAKAHGSITLTNYCYNPGTIAAGTAFTAASGQKFVSDSDVAIPSATPVAGSCPTPSTATVAVTANQNGDQYNLAPTTYAVGSLTAAQVKGQGNQMSGGLTKTINIVTQTDIDQAKGGLVDQAKDGAQKDLESKSSSNTKPISESFIQTVGAATSSPAVGEEAGQATLTVHMTYSELLVPKADFTKVVQGQEQKSVGDANQIYDDGQATAKITASKPDASGKQSFELSTVAYAGAKLDPTAIAKQLAGKRYGDAADAASKMPGVDRVEISIWPGFASSLPRITGHIHVDIKVAKRN